MNEYLACPGGLPSAFPGSTWENSQIFSFLGGRWRATEPGSCLTVGGRSRWARSHIYQIPCKFSSFLSPTLQPGWIHRRFSLWTTVRGQQQAGICVSGILCCPWSRVDGCQVCIGDKKVPREMMSQEALGWKGCLLWGWGQPDPSGFPSTFHGREWSN